MENLNMYLEKYAELILKVGINVQPKQEVVLNAPIEAKDFVRAFVKKAYEMKSGRVNVFYNDEELQPILFDYASDEVITTFPEYRKDTMLKLVESGAALVSISATNPTLLKDCDQSKVAAARKAASIAMQPIYKYIGTGKTRWNGFSVPTVAWAKQVFPELSDSDAYNKLWEYIFKCTRVDQEDPIAAWEEHVGQMKEKRDYLNKMQFAKLHYKSDVTDLSVELPKGHIWVSGGSKAQDGHEFIPNIPTEEIFTMNNRDGVNGVLASTMPLNYNGNLIEDFVLTFKQGKVVDFKAAKNQAVLENMLNTDEGAKFLGEVALVPFDSPISNLETVFYNTLYDENASCHFALGRAYPYTLEKGIEMEKDELKEHGANDSLIHVDFMVGSEKLDIDAYTESGEVYPIFRNGNWAF